MVKAGLRTFIAGFQSNADKVPTLANRPDWYSLPHTGIVLLSLEARYEPHGVDLRFSYRISQVLNAKNFVWAEIQPCGLFLDICLIPVHGFPLDKMTDTGSNAEIRHATQRCRSLDSVYAAMRKCIAVPCESNTEL